MGFLEPKPAKTQKAYVSPCISSTYKETDAEIALVPPRPSTEPYPSLTPSWPEKTRLVPYKPPFHPMSQALQSIAFRPFHLSKGFSFRREGRDGSL